jgi:hypothetical protein
MVKAVIAFIVLVSTAYVIVGMAALSALGGVA